jgi:hypothetical protein
LKYLPIGPFQGMSEVANDAEAKTTIFQTSKNLRIYLH